MLNVRIIILLSLLCSQVGMQSWPTPVVEAAYGDVQMKVDTASDLVGRKTTVLFFKLENSDSTSIPDAELTISSSRDISVNNSKSSADCKEDGGKIVCSPIFIAGNDTSIVRVEVRHSEAFSCKNNPTLTLSLYIPGVRRILQTATSGGGVCNHDENSFENNPKLNGIKTTFLELPNTAKAGETRTIKVRLENNSSTDIPKGEFKFVLNDAAFIKSGSSSECERDPHSYAILCPFMPLNAGTSKTFTAKFTLDSNLECFEQIQGSTIAVLWGPDIVPGFNDAFQGHDIWTYIDCDIPKPPQADVEIQKEAIESSVPLGGDISYNITIKNNGPDTAQNVQVRDTIPSGLTFKSATGPTNCSQQGSEVVCNPLTLSNGDREVYTLTFQAPITTDACDTSVTNTAHITSGTPDNRDSNNSDTSGNTKIICGEITLYKSVNHSTAEKNSSIEYTIRVVSKTSAGAQGIVVRDVIPDGLRFEPQLSDASCSVQGNTIECRPDDIVGKNTKYIVLTFTVLPSAVCGETITNVAKATAEHIPGEVEDDAVFTVKCTPPKITIEKSVDKTEIQPGGGLTYTIVVKNTGETTAENIVVTDAFPRNAGVTFQATGSGPNCALNGYDVVCTSASLAAGADITFTVRATTTSTVACDSTIANSASVDANNASRASSSTVKTTVICEKVPLLHARKEADVTVLNKGDRIVYTIVIENSGNGDATDVMVHDIIPLGLRFDATQSNARCQVSGISVECGTFTVPANSTLSVKIGFIFDALAG
ncbi:DUF11 domain-containing protein [Candidatus Peribacteria bacterium]|nr:DUF11 domain-containing protein [Candidatus Peribacteria bacterium]